MKEFIPIIAAAMAFIGTITGLIIVYRKWKKEQTSKRFGQFEIDKQNAYKKLWDQVEDFNIKVRIEDVNLKKFSTHLQNMNALILKNGIYIDDTDKKLANEYMASIFNFQNIVKDSNITEAHVALEDTRDIPDSIINSAKEIGEAQKRALELRAELKQRIKFVLSGNKN